MDDKDSLLLLCWAGLPIAPEEVEPPVPTLAAEVLVVKATTSSMGVAPDEEEGEEEEAAEVFLLLLLLKKALKFRFLKSLSLSVGDCPFVPCPPTPPPASAATSSGERQRVMSLVSSKLSGSMTR